MWHCNPVQWRFILVQYTDLSIKARVALCLVYAEKMIPTIKTLINRCDKGYAGKYSIWRQHTEHILELAWRHLQDKFYEDWSEMYRLCDAEQGFLSDVEENGGYGWFEFVQDLKCSDNEDNVTISDVMILCFYYALYNFAKRQQGEVLPQDLEWFDLEESEAETFSCIEEAANFYMPHEDVKKIEKLREKLCKLFPFDESDPYGKDISREFMYSVLL